MSVLKPRNRLVYFRLSEEEYQRLTDICAAGGARSMSELARAALNRVTGDQDHGQALDALLRSIEQATERLNELTAMLRMKAESESDKLV
jgi:hypothetical protein